MKNDPNIGATYQAFGLTIYCELPTASLFGLTPVPNVLPDASIRIGSVPVELEDAVMCSPYISYAPGRLLLNIKGFARYLITDGQEITVEIEPEAQDGDVATFAFGTAMGTLLYQRHILALHGSAVRTAKGAVIFTGDKGAGKSTSAAALSERGWEFMSDDVCAVHIENGKALLHPGLSRAKLTSASYATVLGRQPDAPPVSPVMDKYGVSFAISREPAPLYAICALETTDGDPYIEPVSGGAKRLEMLSDNVYRPFIHELVETPTQRFLQYTTAASQAHAFRAFRSLDFSKMDAFLHLIEDTILS